MRAITINGKSYASWDEVPPELRAMMSGLPDSDGDGVPDLFSTGELPPDATTTSVTHTTVRMGDKTWESTSDGGLPPEINERLRDILAKPHPTGGAGSEGGIPFVLKVGDKTYDSTEQLPPETRMRLRDLMSAAGGTPPTNPAPEQAPAEQVILNGVPVDLDAATGEPRRKHWWKRG